MNYKCSVGRNRPRARNDRTAGKAASTASGMDYDSNRRGSHSGGSNLPSSADNSFRNLVHKSTS